MKPEEQVSTGGRNGAGLGAWGMEARMAEGIDSDS